MVDEFRHDLMHPTTWLVDQSIHLEGTRRLEDELNDLEEIAGGSCYLIADNWLHRRRIQQRLATLKTITNGSLKAPLWLCQPNAEHF
jgi:hypothetical protein